MKDDDKYGINIEDAHKKARKLIPEEFFWDGLDPLLLFGSDEGDMALFEYREWRKANPAISTHECLKWTIESVGEMELSDYNNQLLDRTLIQSQIEDETFEDEHFIYTLDVSVIATGFAQLVDEGKIEPANKPFIQLAIDRQRIWASLLDWSEKEEYIRRLIILERALKAA